METRKEINKVVEDIEYIDEKLIEEIENGYKQINERLLSIREILIAKYEELKHKENRENMSEAEIAIIENISYYLGSIKLKPLK